MTKYQVTSSKYQVAVTCRRCHQPVEFPVEVEGSLGAVAAEVGRRAADLVERHDCPGRQPCTCPGDTPGPWEPDWEGTVETDPDCFWHGPREAE